MSYALFGWCEHQRLGWFWLSPAVRLHCHWSREAVDSLYPHRPYSSLNQLHSTTLAEATGAGWRWLVGLLQPTQLSPAEQADNEYVFKVSPRCQGGGG